MDVARRSHITRITTPGMSRLPVELLRMILVAVAIDSPADRQRLIGVCFCWKEILCGTHFLWTTVSICAMNPTDEQFQRFLSNLSNQLSRCGTLMLDVTWNLAGLKKHAATSLFTILSRQALFSRWRSLELWDYARGSLAMADLRKLGDFGNLECLIICNYTSKRLLTMVNKSATSSLIDLRIRTWISPLQIRSEIDGILKHVHRLEISEQDLPFTLPSNIVELRTSGLPLGNFPSIKTLSFTSRQSITALNDQSLPNLTSLVISFVPVHPSFSGSVPLPNIESLTVYGSEFGALAHLSTPKLGRLAIQVSPSFAPYVWEVNSLTRTFIMDGYSLSPSEELNLGLPLPTTTLALALSKMPQAKNLTLHMYDVQKEWLDVFLLLANVNLDLTQVGSALLAETLVLKPTEGISGLDYTSRRQLAGNILKSLSSTSINTLKIIAGDGSRVTIDRKDLFT